MENPAPALLSEKTSSEQELRLQREEIAALKAALAANQEQLARAKAQLASRSSDSKQVEEALHASQYDLEQFVNLSPVPMVIWRGPTHIYSLVNAAHDRMLGKNVVGKTIREAHTEEEAPKIPLILDRVYQTGEAFISREVPYTIRGDDGHFRPIWVHEWFYPFRDLSGQVAGILGVAQDVTEQKLLALDVENRRQQLQNYFMQAPIAICVLDGPQHIFTLSNPLYDQLTKRSVLGKKVREAFADGEAALFFDLLDRVYQTGEPFLGKETSVSFIEASGQIRERFVDFSYHPLRDSHGQVYSILAMHIDVTERKQTGEALRAATAEAERANEAKSRFLAAASHDLRQPVSSLSLLMALLTGELATQPKAIKLVGQMKRALDALSGLLNSTLDLSRIDAGVVIPEIESVDVDEMLDGLVAEYDRHCEAKKLALRWRRTPRLRVRADPALMQRILRNLIENAIRYTGRGGILIAGRQQQDRVRIDVVDTGIGIPADRQAEIFEEFYQIDNPGRDQEQGLGLGLAIVARLVHLLAGEVRVTSRLGRGSRFSIFLPRDSDAYPATLVQSLSEPAQSDGLFRILLIEDNALLRETMQEMLEMWDFEVLAAANGEDALDLGLREGWQFDAVIVDHRLGAGLSGAATAKEIERQAGRPFPVLVTTGDTAKERIAELHASGYTILHKPVSMEDFSSKLDELRQARELLSQEPPR